MQASKSFLLLQKLVEDSKRHARALPEESSLGKKNWLGILFQLMNKRWVVPLEEIQEVIYLPQITPMPGMLDWFLGVGQLRGELLTLNDLQGLIYGVGARSNARSRVFVLRHEGELIGFVIDRLWGLIYASEKDLDLKEGDTKTQNPGRDYYAIGKVKAGDAQYSVFSLKKILERDLLWNIRSTMLLPEI
ncbi:MAG: chemotaxis protein CheW [Gammaproteobacteria bacterium]